jgi:hydroxymethylbilane synthase
MNHEKTFIEAMVEREVIKELGIGCAIPAGVYAKLDGKIELICEILSHDGRDSVRVEEVLNQKTAIEEALEVARTIREIGGDLIATG